MLRRLENYPNNNIYCIDDKNFDESIGYPVYLDINESAKRCKLLADKVYEKYSNRFVYNYQFIGRGSSGMYIVGLISYFLNEKLKEMNVNTDVYCYHDAKEEELVTKHGDPLRRLNGHNTDDSIIIWCDDFISSGLTFNNSQENVYKELKKNIDLVLLLAVEDNEISDSMTTVLGQTETICILRDIEIE
jgi:orotate phosphoribosyltransferase-like protein